MSELDKYLVPSQRKTSGARPGDFLRADAKYVASFVPEDPTPKGPEFPNIPDAVYANSPDFKAALDEYLRSPDTMEPSRKRQVEKAMELFPQVRDYVKERGVWARPADQAGTDAANLYLSPEQQIQYKKSLDSYGKGLQEIYQTFMRSIEKDPLSPFQALGKSALQTIRFIQKQSAEEFPNSPNALLQRGIENLMPTIGEGEKYGDWKIENMPLPGMYNTDLTGEQEDKFQEWVKQYKKKNDLNFYDLRGWWVQASQEERDKFGRGEIHAPDTWKKPNHPTFSNESIYSDVNHPGGHWEGEKFVPPPENREQISAPQRLALNFISGTIRLGPQLLSAAVTDPAGFALGAITFPFDEMEIISKAALGKRYFPEAEVVAAREELMKNPVGAVMLPFMFYGAYKGMKGEGVKGIPREEVPAEKTVPEVTLPITKEGEPVSPISPESPVPKETFKMGQTVYAQTARHKKPASGKITNIIEKDGVVTGLQVAFDRGTTVAVFSPDQVQIPAATIALREYNKSLAQLPKEERAQAKLDASEFDRTLHDFGDVFITERDVPQEIMNMMGGNARQRGIAMGYVTDLMRQAAREKLLTGNLKDPVIRAKALPMLKDWLAKNVPAENKTVGELNLAPGDRVMMSGEWFKVEPAETPGDIVLKDGRSMTVDVFDRLDVQRVVKTSEIGRVTQEINAPSPKPKPSIYEDIQVEKIPDEVMVDREVVNPETGETGTIKQNAKDALKESRDQSELMQKLLDCLGRGD